MYYKSEGDIARISKSNRLRLFSVKINLQWQSVHITIVVIILLNIRFIPSIAVKYFIFLKCIVCYVHIRSLLQLGIIRVDK